MMTHVFGSTALAVGTVLAAVMSGLTLGSCYAGKLADRSGNSFRLYAWLEIGIGLHCGHRQPVDRRRRLAGIKADDGKPDAPAGANRPARVRASK